jgi:hypothetical protein
MKSTRRAVTTKPKKRRRTVRQAPSIEVEVFRFLLARISDKDWGDDTRTMRDRNRPVPHANTANRIRDSLNSDPLTSGCRAFCRSISHRMLWEHQVGERTLCFTGNGQKKAPESLFLIDVDCKDRPNPVQARQFLEDLKADPHVPDFARLFVEPSSSGGGAHGYGVLVKSPGLGAEAVNNCLKALQVYVRRRLAEGHPLGLYGDITDVEIKGTCFVPDWKDERCVEVRCGQLAKIPVTALDRPREFLGLAKVPVEVLCRLHSAPIAFPEASLAAASSKTTDVSPRRKGSTRTHPIPRAVIERIGSVYSAVAHKYAPRPLPTSGRHVATVEDVAIYLAIAGYITLHQGEDKAMPSRRIEAIWNAMYKAEDVRRPHCVKRVAAIRNHLSDLGLIAWEDERFWSPDKCGRFGGNAQKGVCCKYGLSPEIMEELGLSGQETGLSQARESTAGTDPVILPFTLSREKAMERETTTDPHDLRLLNLERPVIRPIRVGWASEFWGREAA